MEQLKKRRSAIKTSVSRIETFLRSATSDTDIESIQTRLERIEEQWKEFDTIQTQIETATDDTDFPNETKYREEIEEKYLNVKSIALKLISSISKASNSLPSSIQSNLSPRDPRSDLSNIVHTLTENQTALASILERLSSNNVTQQSGINANSTLNTSTTMIIPEIKLPRLDIPTFSGEYKEWPSFKDLYDSLVHKNTSLTGVQKLQYLKMSLKGEPSSLLRHLGITDANYTQAYQELTARYDKDYCIVDAFIKNIVEQPTLAHASASSLKKLFNNINESIRGLKALKLPVEHWDAILIYLVVNKLDSESKQLWARQRPTDTRPTYKSLKQFLEKRQFELESTQTLPKHTSRTYPPSKSSYSVTTTVCIKCKGNHHLFKCPAFKNLDLIARKRIISINKLCINCLRPGHNTNECRSTRCMIYKRTHHTLLHDDQASTNQILQGSTSTATTLMTQASLQTIHLPTAVVLVKDASNQLQPCRALLDTGSSITLISETCSNRLRLKRSNARISNSGIGSTKSTCSNGSVNLRIHSRINEYELQSVAVVLRKLTTNLPQQAIASNVCQYFHDNFTLADPQFDRPNKIDIIFGADIVFSCLMEGKAQHPDSEFIAQNTSFGWVITGSISKSNQNIHTSLHMQQENVDENLKRFWEVEDIKNFTNLTEEEAKCEEHFLKNHTRDETGRYIVRLPFKEDYDKLGNSKNAARSSLLCLEKRLQKSTQLAAEYSEFLREYIQLRHMHQITEDVDLDDKNSFYLPHHPVIKDTSTTTRLRVVFNASRPTTSGVSLNDTLMVGPTIQLDTFSLLLRFRKFKVAFTADIAKMFRQIKMHEKDSNYQLILWRWSIQEPIKVFKLSTVTYGTAPAPFLATRTLKQLSIDEGHNFPEAAKVLNENFYIDDVCYGHHSLEEAIHLRDDLIDLLKKGGFELRKWSSNSPVFTTDLRTRHAIHKTVKLIDDSKVIKILGMNWNVPRDAFSFEVSVTQSQTITKRHILSNIAKIFDPMGLISPCVIKLKILLQQLWTKGLSWDEDVPDDIRQTWVGFSNNLQQISKLHFPRWIGFQLNCKAQLHAFSDASELAYAGAVYLRIIDTSGKISVQLVAAKTKVAPIKQLSIPRLELCAAQLATKLLMKCQEALDIEDVELYAWTDSMIVIAWLSDIPRKWKTFIGNRTSYILQYLPSNLWRHVKSQQNPADCASRGLNASELLNHTLWFQGPGFFYNEQLLQTMLKSTKAVTDLEVRTTATSHLIVAEPFDILERFSSLWKLKRVVAYCMRFHNNCNSPKIQRNTSSLSVAELSTALNLLIRHAQQLSYPTEISCLRSKKPLPSKSKLIQLNPFIDNNDILRVGGRLQNANISYSQKHPAILAKDCNLAKLIISDTHLRYFHAGRNLTFAIIRIHYWILGCKDLIRQHIYQCITCVRHRGQTCQQQMSNLPAQRVQPAPPFYNSGVDYAGPVYIRAWKGRGTKTYKSYIALFICLATKAIHLELVSEMTTDAFVAALKRFIARRGHCAHIFSDNGTNFIGAKNQLHELGKLLASKLYNDTVLTELNKRMISWHTIPPRGPHFGSIWETGVKQMKFHLTRIVGSSYLTYEELSTLLCQIEACLNSRPLIPESPDPDSFEALTPGHFLVGRTLLSYPEPNIDDTKIDQRSRWQYLRTLQQTFWRKWSADYINNLQQRTKWMQPHKNLIADDLVIIKEDNLPPCSWLLARVQTVHPGKDGLVRVVTLRTKAGVIQRPIHKLCYLPTSNQNDSLESTFQGRQNVGNAISQ